MENQDTGKHAICIEAGRCISPVCFPYIGRHGTKFHQPSSHNSDATFPKSHPLTTHPGDHSLRALLLLLPHGGLTIARFTVPSLRTARNIVHSIVVYNSLAQSYLTLCNPVACSLPDSSVHGILQARILE